MKPKSELSQKLYQVLLRRGYPAEFADLITRNLNTDFTAKRMLGYLRQYPGDLSPEELADEMLAILSDRARIMEKKNMETNNARWNLYMMQGFGAPEEVDDSGLDEFDSPWEAE